MFVERSGEVGGQQLPVEQSQAQQTTSKAEVAQVVRVDGGIAVWLESAT